MLTKLFSAFSKRVTGPKESNAYLDYIKLCRWKDDITIERASFIGTGSYSSVKGQAYHTVSCAADGPNGDSGKTMHHAWIGHWRDFSSFEEANAFAGVLYNKVIELTGYTPHIYASRKDKEAYASWCMGKVKTRPRGIAPNALPSTFKGYK